MTDLAADPSSRDDDGISMVLVALSLVALLLVAALAVDGGQAYANRRQMQNAADAGAMAGARQYAATRFDPPATVADVVAAVRDTVAANGGDTSGGALGCWMVDSAGSRVSADICATPTLAWTAATPGAAGVEVSASAEKKSFFAQVGGIDTFSAEAGATATMQPLVSPGGTVPFLVCSMQAGHPSGAGLALSDTTTVNPAAVGQLFELQGAQIENCGASSNAGKGLAGERTPTVGEWMDVTTGNRFDADTATAVLGLTPCPQPIDDKSDLDGCSLVLPIVNAARGNGAGTELYVVNFAVFQAWGNGTGNGPVECDPLGKPTPKYCGRLVRTQVEGGTTGDGGVTDGQAYAVRLID